MLLQVLHERRATRPNISRVSWTTFGLPVDIGGGILEVARAELRQPDNAFVVNRLECLRFRSCDKMPQR